MCGIDAELGPYRLQFVTVASQLLSDPLRQVFMIFIHGSHQPTQPLYLAERDGAPFSKDRAKVAESGEIRYAASG